MLRHLGQVLVHVTAIFTSAVLSHPQVVTAGSNVMLAGMNAFMSQPDLAEKLKRANQQMSVQEKQEVAVQIGRDLPVLMGGIFYGVFSRNDDNDKKSSIEEEKQDDENMQVDETCGDEQQGGHVCK